MDKIKPLTSFRELDALGEELSREYTVQTRRWNARCFDIEGFITDYLKLKIVYETFAEKDGSKIGFLANGIDPLLVRRDGVVASVVFPKDTIVIEKYLLKSEESCRRRFTLAHEAAHHIMDRHAPQKVACFRSDFDNEAAYSDNDLHRIFSINESLTNRLGAAILMPGFLIAKALKKYNDSNKLKCYSSSEGMVLAQEDKMKTQRMADSLGVSYSALLNRLKELNLLDYHPLSEYIRNGLQIGGNC